MPEFGSGFRALVPDFIPSLLDTIDIDSDDDDVCGISVCANCKRQHKNVEELNNRNNVAHVVK